MPLAARCASSCPVEGALAVTGRNALGLESTAWGAMGREERRHPGQGRRRSPGDGAALKWGHRRGGHRKECGQRADPEGLGC